LTLKDSVSKTTLHSVFTMVDISALIGAFTIRSLSSLQAGVRIRLKGQVLLHVKNTTSHVLMLTIMGPAHADTVGLRMPRF
jgi:hypothetical protein